MLDILDLKIFATVVRLGSLSAAARELNYSVPVISKRLAKLEDRLDVRLVHRTTRSLTLTDVGEGFYERVIEALDAVEQAHMFARATGKPAGYLRVSAPTGFGRRHIAPHLRTLLALYPEIKLRLDLADEFVDLVDQGYDVAIRIGSLEDSSLVARRLSDNRRYLCASKDYLARHDTPTKLDELSDHRLFTTTAQKNWLLEGPDGSISYTPKQFLVTNSSEVVRACMLDGMGIALRSTWDVCEELKKGQLVRILPEYSGLQQVGIYALYPSRQQLAPQVRAFIEFFADLLKPAPYWDEGI